MKLGAANNQSWMELIIDDSSIQFHIPVSIVKHAIRRELKFRRKKWFNMPHTTKN